MALRSAASSSQPRRFVDFLGAMRAAPGFGFRVAMTTCFATSLWITKGAVAVLVSIGIGLAIIVVFGYPRYRRRGRIG